MDVFVPKPERRQGRQETIPNQAWRKVFHAGILIEPHIPELEEFKDYFNGAIKVVPKYSR